MKKIIISGNDNYVGYIYRHLRKNYPKDSNIRLIENKKRRLKKWVK